MTPIEAPGAGISGRQIHYLAGRVRPGKGGSRGARGRLENDVDAYVLPGLRKSHGGRPKPPPSDSETNALKAKEARYEADEHTVLTSKSGKGKQHGARHTRMRGLLEGNAHCQVSKPHPGYSAKR